MKRIALTAALALAALSLGTLRVRADGVGVNDIGRYRPLEGNVLGVLDTWTGTVSYTDPADTKHVVSIDFPAARVAVLALETGKGSWQAPPTLSGGGLPDAKGANFVQSGDRLEIVDTRNGDDYSLEGAKGKASEWKEGAVQVVLTSRIAAKEVKQALKRAP